MTLVRSTVLALVCLFFAGCAGGPPVQYYTLVPVAAQQTMPAQTPPIQIADIHLPGTLDRSDMVRALSPTHLQLDDSRQWAAPLAEMIARVLTQDLQSRLGKSNILPPAATAPLHSTQITLDILDFTPRADGTLVFDGTWHTQNATASETHNLHLTTASTAGDADSQAQAMSTILGRVADAIAAGTASQP